MDKTRSFACISETEDCGVIIYDKRTRREISRFPFPKEKRIGKKYRMTIPLDDRKDYLYQFWQGKCLMPDPRGRQFWSPKKYGEGKGNEDIFTVLEEKEYDWKNSVNPKIPYERCFVYCIHARGFTKHASSGVKMRGTFLGVTEKLDYLKKIGVTTLEFQPIYEFNEKPKGDDLTGHSGTIGAEPRKLNYWGYEKGFYYAPKADYAWKNPVFECKEMIRLLHEAGMEAVLQFYFPAEVNSMDIPEVLRFWTEEYHVDGFHLIGENLPADLIAKDPELSESKIWYYQFNPESVYGKREIPAYKNLALVRDDFMYEGRRFLKGDENVVPSMMRQLRELPASVGRINYLSTYWGFTLMDAVSYDFKHNEQNGEENRDGTDYNCSWNCGEEGVSRKKKILSLRLKQIKNAYCLLLFAQATPRIFMGDEFGNSQKGNNNPYCQDNEITWLNWTNAEKNAELLNFFIELQALRRNNPVLRPGKEAQMMDSISCGYPDLSFHGETAWRPQMENYSRQLGVAYCGLYREKDLGIRGRAEKQEDGAAGACAEEFLYLGINMHWEPHNLGLPRLPKGKRWELVWSTNGEADEMDQVQDHAVIPPKSISLYACKKGIESKLGKEAENKAAESQIKKDGID